MKAPGTHAQQLPSRHLEGRASLIDVSERLHAIGVVHFSAEALALLQLHKEKRYGGIRRPSRGTWESLAEKGRLTRAREDTQQARHIEVVVGGYPERLTYQMARIELRKDERAVGELRDGERRAKGIPVAGRCTLEVGSRSIL